MPRLYFARLPNRHTHHHLAATRLSPGQVTFAHTHDFPEIFFVTRGAGIHVWNGRKLPLVRGTVTWIAPADLHYFCGGPKSGIEFINLALASHWGADFARLFRPRLVPNSPVFGGPRWHCVMNEMETARLEREFGAWVAADPGGPHWLVQMTAMLMRFLVAQPVADRHVTTPEWLVRWSADLAVPKLIPEPLAFWQKRSGRSPEHLARSCRRFYGAVPTEIISRARIALVQTRLRQGEGKIAALALDAGFQNLGYFYRTFRRIVGAPPGVWLAAQMADAAVPR
jgi:AraC family cel operon transcriptional repressor